MSTVTTDQTLITPEQMHERSGDRLTELVNGRLVEKDTGTAAHFVVSELHPALNNWGKQNDAGRSFVEATYRCFPHAPTMVRRPDVSFVPTDRLKG